MSINTLVLSAFCILILASSQAFLKYGLSEVGGVNFSRGRILAGLLKIISTPYIPLGFALYAISAVLWLDVLSKLELSVAYPLVSLSYIFSLLIGRLVFHEPVGAIRVIGLRKFYP